MSIYNFAIQAGYVANPTNVESIITYPPSVLPDQLLPLLGPNRKVTQDGMVQRSGTPSFYWTMFMSRTDFNTYVTTVFGGFNVASVRASIVTLDETNNYAWAYVIAERPAVSEHYTVAIGGQYLLDVKQPFTLDADSGLGAFSTGFSFGFEV